MAILAFCDEAGDTGYPLKEGTSRTYVASTVFVHSPKADALRHEIKVSKRHILELRHPAEWKRLSSSMKLNDVRIAQFVHQITGLGGLMFGSAVVDKRRLSGEGLTDPKTQTLAPYAHGLVFKNTLHYISQYDFAEFYMDRNSSIPTQENLKNYLSKEIPSELRLRTTIAAPKFISPKDDYLLQLADFVSGVTRVMFDSYLEAKEEAEASQGADLDSAHPGDIPGFRYPLTYQALVPYYVRQLPRWRWNALLYHPFWQKEKVTGFFPGHQTLPLAK